MRRPHSVLASPWSPFQALRGQASSWRACRWVGTGVVVGYAVPWILEGSGTPCYAAEVPISIGGGGKQSSRKTASPTSDPPANDGLCTLVYRDGLTHEALERLATSLLGEADGSVDASYLKYDRLRAHVNALGKEGLSPLMVAAGLGKTEAVAALLHYGANPLQPCACSASTYLAHIFSSFKRGMTALEFGIASGNKDVVAMLFAHCGTLDEYSSAEDPIQAALGGGALNGGEEGEGGVEPFKAFARSFWYDDKNRAEEVVRAIDGGAALRKETARLQRLRYPLESRLRSRIVGQDHAIQVVSNAVRRKENGWFDSESPLVMLFMGSSGIGKTETAKTVATYLFGEGSTSGRNGTTVRNSMTSGGAGGPLAQMLNPSQRPNVGETSQGNPRSVNPEDCFIRIDMSEYQSKHEVSKFIGSPPGYIGHEQGGQLTSKLEKCPNAVVLLDEVEKAHPDVLSIMLQVFDEGRLTSGKGDTIHCKDAVFVMTSNLAQREIADEAERIRATASVKDARRKEQLINETSKSASKEVSKGGSIGPKNEEETAPGGEYPVTHRRDGTAISHVGTVQLNSRPATHLTFSAPAEAAVPSEGGPTSPLSDDFTRNVVHGILRSHFGRDELIGRVNEIVYFLPFTEDERRRLASMELRKWAARAKSKNNIDLTWSDAAVDRAVRGYNIRYGARSIKYEIDRVLIGTVAKAFEEGAVTKGSTVNVDVVKVPSSPSGKWWGGKGSPSTTPSGSSEERVVLDIVRSEEGSQQEMDARKMLDRGAGKSPAPKWKGWFG